MIYHDLAHTLNVEKSALRLARLEGLDEEEIMLLRTAVLYHDSGFIFTYSRNELHGVRMMEQSLPKYGYDQEQIAAIRSMILATSSGNEPVTLLEQIMCDADHDYLGRADYYMVAEKLREEIAVFGTIMSEEEWLNFQLGYLQHEHKFYTSTSKNIRERGKQNRIAELRTKLRQLQIQE
jgi:HD superfamily phosphodiesterase